MDSTTESQKGVRKNENGQATSYQSKLLHIEASNSGNVNERLLKLEENILMAGRGAR